MSNKKSKPIENNENVCPISRKRIKGTPHSSWKLAKLESSSSPSPLSTEYLDEMGIGMLDSEESSSSAPSSIALVLSASADENSNGTTPNLDAPKMNHHRMTYRAMDNSLDSSLNSDIANNTIGNASLGFLTGALYGDSAIQYNSNISTNTVNEFIDEVKQSPQQHQQQHQYQHQNQQLQLQQQQQLNRNSTEKIVLSHHKKVAILGAGAGVASTSAATTSTAIALSQPYNSNSNSNSPSAGRSTRSPLAAVTCNSYNRNMKSILQQQQQQQQQQALNAVLASNSNGVALSSGSANIPHAVVGGTTSQHSHCTHANHCANQHPALIKHQQRAQLQAHQHHMHYSRLQPTVEQNRFVVYDNFFLFRQDNIHERGSDGKDHFNTLSDEIILQIFKWLPKKALIRCSYVCRRFNRCASDESLWARLDLGGRHLRAGALENILSRGVVILRLAQGELNHPVFHTDFLQAEPKFESKLQYLDLSMVSVAKVSLKMLLSRCRQLKKLSLEHVPVNDEICNEIAKNTGLEALNMAMCLGLEAWSVRKIMESLQNLNSLNISWTNLTVDAVTSVVTNVTPNLMRLNMAGCRKTMYDSHLASLAKRCSQLLELDLSDCTALTGNAINIICKFKMLEYLSLSRCYLIPASSYMDLSNLPTLTYLDIFGMLSDTAMEMLEQNFPNLGINKFIHSSVARPTVGTRRTSIWGLRTRD